MQDMMTEWKMWARESSASLAMEEAKTMRAEARLELAQQHLMQQVPKSNIPKRITNITLNRKFEFHKLHGVQVCCFLFYFCNGRLLRVLYET